jgi:hypothetical protein
MDGFTVIQFVIGVIGLHELERQYIPKTMIYARKSDKNRGLLA